MTLKKVKSLIDNLIDFSGEDAFCFIVSDSGIVNKWTIVASEGDLVEMGVNMRIPTDEEEEEEMKNESKCTD